MLSCHTISHYTCTSCSESHSIHVSDLFVTMYRWILNLLWDPDDEYGMNSFRVAVEGCYLISWPSFMSLFIFCNSRELMNALNFSWQNLQQYITGTKPSMTYRVWCVMNIIILASWWKLYFPKLKSSCRLSLNIVKE